MIELSGNNLKMFRKAKELESVWKRSREVLEETLAEFDGTLLFVSHDRYFIDRLADRIVVIEDCGTHVINGDYTSPFLSHSPTSQFGKSYNQLSNEHIRKHLFPPEKPDGAPYANSRYCQQNKDRGNKITNGISHPGALQDFNTISQREEFCYRLHGFGHNLKRNRRSRKKQHRKIDQIGNGGSCAAVGSGGGDNKPDGKNTGHR